MDRITSLNIHKMFFLFNMEMEKHHFYKIDFLMSVHVNQVQIITVKLNKKLSFG